MRFGFLALCGFLALPLFVYSQTSAAPTITVQPTGASVYVMEGVSLTVGVDGTAPITYQWRKNSVAITGATNSTFSILSTAVTDTGGYDVVATNSVGSATSIAAPIFVMKRPQTITFNAPASVLAAGSGLTLNAVASSGLPVAYQLVSGSGSLNGNVLVGTGGSIVVRASQSGDATTYDAALPVERTFTFVAGALSPFITSPPVDQTVTAGASVIFRAVAIGTPAPMYQWQKDGVVMFGATESALTLPNVTLGDAGRYSVTATNILGVSNAAAILTVRAAPVFTTMPVSQTVFAGSAVSFTVATTGVPAPTYQWRKNGVPISGATSATLSFANPAAGDAARYDVVATNAIGTATSATATLTVNTRDFTGSYFGTIRATTGASAATGSFGLMVRANGTAVLLGFSPAVPSGIFLSDLAIDLAGTFTRTFTSDGRNVTLRGTLDETSGEVVADISLLGLSFAGTRAAKTGPAAAMAGYYRAAVVGRAADRGNIIVAPDGQAFVWLTNGTTTDAGVGRIGTNGRLTATTSTEGTVDVGFNNGGVSGTVRTAAGASANFSGAIESIAGTEHLINLSIRSTTNAAAPLIAGFVITGTAPKQVLIRAAGPALAQAPFNVPGVVGDPTLQLFRGTTVMAQNDNWGAPAPNAALVTAANARAGAFPFPNNSNDAALVTTLQPGPYTAVIGGGNGTVLAEVYEVLENNESAGVRRLANVSARGVVTPAAPLIVGFVIGGTAPQRVMIRGIGPALGGAPFNVAGSLANPQLTLFRGSTALKTNDDWFRDADATLIRDAATRAGAFPLGAQGADAAMLLFLEPGAYTAQVSGPANANANNGTGIALVEVYESAP